MDLRRTSVPAFAIIALFSAPAPGVLACGDKTYCREMATCAEAHYYLTTCGLQRLDADNDGIPCETQCGKQLETMHARINAQPFKPQVEMGAPTNSDAPRAAGTELLVQPAAEGDLERAGMFECGAKRTCRQMTTCAEAMFYLQSCGLTSLDGNGDSIACNGLCR